MKKFTIYNVQFTIKLIFFVFTFYILHFTFYIPVYALENDIGYSKIHPASPLFFLKTIRENLELKLAFTAHVKRIRQLEFATRRLREAKSLILINQDLIPPTLERYASHLNTLADKELLDKEVATRIKESLGIHLQVLQQMHDQPSSDRAKIAIRSAMNRVILRADVPDDAKYLICNFFAKEASSSARLPDGQALNQTEKVVLTQRAQKCLKNQ